MRVLAIIPARGGSKGIARKNLVDIAEAPLVVHSIRHARLSRRIDRVLVSTDDEEIRDVALAAGAETPFLRPAELAQDEILDLPVFEHALRHLESHEGSTRPSSCSKRIPTPIQFDRCRPRTSIPIGYSGLRPRVTSIR